MTGRVRTREWPVLAGLLLLGLAGATPAYAAPTSVHGPAGVGAAGAPAHAGVRSVVPADGAVLDHGPSEIVLTFDENISPNFVQVALTRSGVVVPTSAPTVLGPVVRLVPTTTPGPGDYVIAFRVVSVDTHPVSGQSRFRVTGPAGSSTPTATVTDPSPVTSPRATPDPAPASTAPSVGAAPSSTGAGPSSGTSPVVFVTGGLLLLAAAGLGVRAIRRG